MPRLVIVAAAAVTLWVQGLPARQPAPSADETTRINAWFEKKFEEQLAFSPIRQTFLGRKSAAIDDMSIAAQDKQLAWRRASVAEMKQSFDYAKLTPEAQTSYDLWIYQLQQAEAALPFRANGYVFDQMSAIHAFFPQLLIAFHRVDDPADLEAYVARIRESGRALRQLIEISKRNVVAGVRPPRFEPLGRGKIVRIDFVFAGLDVEHYELAVVRVRNFRPNDLAVDCFSALRDFSGGIVRLRHRRFLATWMIH